MSTASALWTRLAPGRPAGDATDMGSESKASEPPVSRASGRANTSNATPQSGPAARSGHAMTLLPPTDSVLLFGGADGRVFYDDFYLLEPAHYAQGGDQESPSVNGNRQPGAERLALSWRKLMATHAPARHASPCVSDLQLSSASSSSIPAASRRRSSLIEPPHAGSGRDYHSMHYVPQSPAEEQARGMRVLVVGNVVIAAEQRLGSSDGGNALAFEMQELRVEEVRVRQATLEAQWVPRRIDSMYKPRARHAHSSALIHGQQLFVFGGKSATSSAYFNDLFYFDVIINQWRKPAVAGPAPAARAFASLAASDEHDKLFLYGGTDGRETFGSLFIYDVALGRWDALAGGSVSGDRPACRVGHSLTFAAPHHLVVFGGRQRAKRQNQLFMFDMVKREWRHVSGRSSRSEKDDGELPVGRTAHAAVLYDSARVRSRIGGSSASQGECGRERLIVFGGYAGSHRWLDDLYLVSLPTPAELAQSTAAKTASQRQQQSQSQSQSQSQLQQRRSDRESRLAMSAAYFDATASHTQADKSQAVLTAEPKATANPLLPHQTQQPQLQKSNENEDKDLPAATRPLAQSQPSVRSSSSSARRESQSSGSGSGSSSSNWNSSGGGGGGGVLSDITNQTPNSPRFPSSQTDVSKPNANSSMSLSLSSVSTSPFKSNKRRRLDESSQRQPPVSGQDAGSHSGSSSNDSTIVNVGLQTTMIQVLQRQSELEEGLVRIESMLATQQPPNPPSTHHQHHHHHQYPLPPEHEAPKSPWPQTTTPVPAPSSSSCLDAYVRAQNEALESRLEAMRRKYETLEETFKRTETEKARLREQLVARETELYEAKRSLERNFPPLSERVRAVEDASRAHLATAQVIESKISAVHDILDELRHAGGEGTEAEDSPEKRDRIGSSPGTDAPSSSPPPFYPQRVVLGLEERLRAANTERDALHQQLTEAQARLARAEEKEEHTRRFFLAWFSQDPPLTSSLAPTSLPMPNQ